jgi:hypothetical protein
VSRSNKLQPSKAFSAPPPPTPIKVGDLHFDLKNPRLAELRTNDEFREPEVLKVLWRDMAVDEIALSIASNGYFEYEPMLAVKEGSELVVIEGNRRLAAVKLLRDESLRRSVKATDLPLLSSAAREKLATLPVIVCSREQVWQYIGFKHVNGPQEWEPFSKAEYIARIHNEYGISLEDIAKQIGDKNQIVRRLYTGYMTLKQAEDANVFRRTNRRKRHFSFSHLYTGLDYPGIRSFLEIREDNDEEPVPKRRLKQLGELLSWLYGNTLENQEPLIRSQNPDLRELAEVLASHNGVAALRQGLGLSLSLRAARGDERLFRESLVAAKLHLESARGKLLTGFKGEPDLLTMAGQIRTVAESIFTEMSEFVAPSKQTRAK